MATPLYPFASTAAPDDDIRDRRGQAYARSVPDALRTERGQFFTPDAVCDWMLAWALRQGTEDILDAGCGTGAFLLRAYDCLQARFGRLPGEILAQLHGVELDPAAAEIAAAQLRMAQNESAPDIACGNFLDPACLSDAAFDAIVGNPPYVRAEHLRQSGLQTRTDASAFQEAFAGYLTTHPEQASLFKTSDLYLSFLIRATLLLKPGGRLAYIVSNSWLGTAFGKRLFRFLQAHYRIHWLVESSVERWFSDAAVNAVMLLMERKHPDEGFQASDEPTRILTLKSPLEQLDAGLIENGAPYWERLQTQWRLLEETPDIETEHYRCRTLTLGSGPDGETSPLSFRSRVPQELHELLEQSEGWLPLDRLGKVRYPLKTGINRFFYLSRERAAALGIEPQFLTPVLKSLREIQGYSVRSQDCDTMLFSCARSKGELKARKQTGALSYIEWGETQNAPPRQKRRHPVPWPEVASVRGRAYWYALSPLTTADIFCSRFFDARYVFPMSDPACAQAGLSEDQTFYGLLLNAGYDRQFTAALLNGSLQYLLLELHGRNNLGEGVLQFSRADMAQLPVMDPAAFNTKERGDILETFAALSARPLLPVAQEVLQADRQHLDRLLLRKLTPEPDGWLERIYATLIEKNATRRALARSVRRKPRA